MRLPVAPDCVAGVMYYLVCDEGVGRDFVGCCCREGGKLGANTGNLQGVGLLSGTRYAFGAWDGEREGEDGRVVGFRRVTGEDGWLE